MTPREISGRLTAFAVRSEKETKHMDALAWMAGNYAAFAYHDPRKFPKKPSIIVDVVRDEAQSVESMKAVLRSMMDKAEVIGNGDNAGRA